MTICQPQYAWSRPANPAPTTLTQPTGESFTASMQGDEFFHYYVTSSDVVIEQDPESGIWRQLVLQSGNVSFGKAAHESTQDSALHGTDLTYDIKIHINELIGRSAPQQPSYNEPVTLNKIASSQINAQGENARSRSKRSLTESPITSLPLMVIVVGFRDNPYNENYNWHDIYFGDSDSVADFYKQASNNKFTWRSISEPSAYNIESNTNTADQVDDGIIHVTLDRDFAGAGNVEDSNKGTDYRNAQQDAFRQAAQKVDLSQYDINHNGKLESNELGIVFVYAGVEQANIGQDITPKPLGIWSHQWRFLDDYTAQDRDGSSFHPTNFVIVSENEYAGNPSTLSQSGPGGVCHELGHYLGLPDLYSTSASNTGAWSRYQVNRLSIMASGDWALSPGKIGTQPNFFDPWSMVKLGWVEPEVVSSTVDKTVSAIQANRNTQTVIRVNVPGTQKEYYLIENRENNSYDSYLGSYYPKNNNAPYGILIWHIDDSINEQYARSNQVNAIEHRPGVMPLFPESGSLSDPTVDLLNPSLSAQAAAINSDFSSRNLIAYNASNVLSGRTKLGITISTSDNLNNEMTVKIVFPSNNQGSSSSGFFPGGSSSPAPSQEGSWSTSGGQTMFVLPDGNYATGWKEIEGNWYFFDTSQGVLQTGWQYLNGAWYYLNNSGAMQTGWQSINGSWYYLQDWGGMATGWQYVEGVWYYLSSWGGMTTGWQSISGSWYYLNSSGVMLTDWLSDGSNWYYLSASGSMVTGWQEVNGSWYYFNTSGSMQTGWIKTNGSWYYLNESGAWVA